MGGNRGGDGALKALAKGAASAKSTPRSTEGPRPIRERHRPGRGLSRLKPSPPPHQRRRPPLKITPPRRSRGGLRRQHCLVREKGRHSLAAGRWGRHAPGSKQPLSATPRGLVRILRMPRSNQCGRQESAAPSSQHTTARFQKRRPGQQFQRLPVRRSEAQLPGQAVAASRPVSPSAVSAEEPVAVYALVERRGETKRVWRWSPGQPYQQRTHQPSGNTGRHRSPAAKEPPLLSGSPCRPCQRATSAAPPPHRPGPDSTAPIGPLLPEEKGRTLHAFASPVGIRWGDRASSGGRRCLREQPSAQGRACRAGGRQRLKPATAVPGAPHDPGRPTRWRTASPGGVGPCQAGKALVAPFQPKRS